MSEGFTPTVRKIVEVVRTRISQGLYPTGNSLPSEGELAAELKVSRGSIRAAIAALVRTGELDKARHSRPFVAKPFAGCRASSNTDVHVWVAQTIRDETSVPFLQGISRELAGTPLRMIVHEPSYFVENIVQADERKFLTELSDRPNVAGAIIWRDVFAENADAVVPLLKKDIPIIFVDSPAPGGLETDFVGTSNVASAKRCVKHLLDQGHCRIVCISDTDIPVPLKDRVKGYWRAMRQAGLDAPGSDLFAKFIVPPLSSCDGVWNDPLRGVYARSLNKDCFYSDLAHRIVVDLLKIDPLPTALFVTYDILACWIWAVLEGKGISVPDQISIVGFDWRAQWDKSLADALDTAVQDFEGFGRHAVELLLDRIAGEAPASTRHVLLDAPLIVRSSTATPRPLRPERILAASVQGAGALDK